MNNQPLLAADATVIFIDLQEGIINIAVTADAERLRTSAGGLAELTNIFKLPVFVACVPTMGGTVAPTLAEIATRLPSAPQHVRSNANAFQDDAIRAALEASGRKTLIIAGVAIEVAVALTAVAAQRAGYTAIVAVDACGGLDARSESATFTDLSTLGVRLSTISAIAAELAGDFTSERGRAAMQILASTIRTVSHAHSDHDHDHDHDHDYDQRGHDHDGHNHDHGSLN